MSSTQKACPHVFIGRADGVHCTRCGLHLTAQQYHELLHPPEDEQEAADTAPDKAPTGDEKPAESAADAPQAKPKKKTAKKKVTSNE